MFSCTKCDAQYLKWSGRCTTCGGWGTLVEESDTPATIGGMSTKSSKKPTAKAALIDFANTTTIPSAPEPTTITELDRTLGGGIVKGSVTLLAGEPGIGKSTLLAELASKKGATGAPVLYASGEESEGQLRLRFSRLKLVASNLLFTNTVDVRAIVAAAEKAKPSLLIVDSIQTMLVDGLDALPGSPTTVRAATAELIGFAKQTDTPVILVGQVTKDGNVAGPKTLEHLVDTVLTLEGDPEAAYRLLRVGKHRFGSTDEVGVFEMTEEGLIPVDNPSTRFLKERTDAPGSVITCIMEGNRPFLIEIQALVERSFYPAPLRRTSGIDSGRLQMLLAILSKHTSYRFHDQDVYVNVVGSLSIKEHAADLAIAAAVLSSVKNTIIPRDTIIFGELGLSGEVRSVPFMERRIKEAERLGYKNITSPKILKSVKEI